MATGGSEDNDLIEDEVIEDDAGEDFIKEFEGSNATIMFHFFKNTDLKKMSEKYNCLIKCEPPKVPMVRKLELRFKSKYDDAVERHLAKMMQEMSKFESKKFTFDISSATKLTEYLKNPDLLDSPVCYICDIASGSVDIIGRSYEELMQAEHKLKLHLGLIKTTGRHRIQRHISDPGNGSDPSTTGLPERTYADIAKQSSIRETNPDPSLKTSVSSLASINRFSRSYSGGSTQTSRALSTGEEFYFETTLKNNFMLKVYKGSIVDLEVEVIVNAANDNMMHGGGVARVISRAAGWDMDKESEEYVKRNGNVKVGENIVTTAGNLRHYRAVIHAVGPIWYDYRNKVECLDDLGECIYNLLATCGSKKFKTVAMPAISAGIYAVPKELCADTYVEAAARFSKSLQDGDCPRELHIVDIDTSILKYVENSIKKWTKDPQSVNPRVVVPKFLEENPHLAKVPNPKRDDNIRGRGGQGRTNSSPDQRSFSGQGQAAKKYLYDDKKQEEKSNRKSGELKESQSNMGNQRDTDVSQTGTGSYGRQGHAGQSSRTSSDRTNRYNLKNPMKCLGEQTFMWGGRAKLYELGSKITIKIFKGDITKTNNMDAIVCCIDTMFSNNGYINNAIATAGGDNYKKNFTDMERKYLSSSHLGSIFKCKAGKLGVHHVMHVVMARISSFTEEKFQAYSSIIKMVLQKANEWKYPKLVIPLFGTGAVQNAGKPEELKSCCASVLKGLDDYLADKGMKGKVTDVHLVNSNQAVCQTLINVFDEASGFVHRKPSDSMSNAGARPRGIRPQGRSRDRGIDQESGHSHPASRDHRLDDRSHGDRQPGRDGFESSRRGRGSEQTQEGNRHSDSRCDRDGEGRGGEKNNSGRFASENDYGSRNHGLEGATADYAEIADSSRMNISDTDSDKEPPPIPDRPGKKKGNLMIIE